MGLDLRLPVSNNLTYSLYVMPNVVMMYEVVLSHSIGSGRAPPINVHGCSSGRMHNAWAAEAFQVQSDLSEAQSFEIRMDPR